MVSRTMAQDMVSMSVDSEFWIAVPNNTFCLSESQMQPEKRDTFRGNRGRKELYHKPIGRARGR